MIAPRRLHVGALSILKRSVMRAVISGGLAFLAVLTNHLMALYSAGGSGAGARPRRADWPCLLSPAAASCSRCRQPLFGISDISLKFLTQAACGGLEAALISRGRW